MIILVFLHIEKQKKLNLLVISGQKKKKNPPANARDVSSTPGLGRTPGEGNGNPLQYACLENPMDRKASWATVHRVAKSQTQLSN